MKIGYMSILHLKGFKPNIISFTGVDEFTSFDKLQRMYAQFPNIELGICILSLKSAEKTQSRLLERVQAYPELPWVAHFSEEATAEALCTYDAILSYESKYLFEKETFYEIDALYEIKKLTKIRWRRIQFNFDWKNYLNDVEFHGEIKPEVNIENHTNKVKKVKTVIHKIEGLSCSFFNAPRNRLSQKM